MPNPVRSGARLRRAAVLMLAALVAVPAAVAAAPPSTADADGGVPEDAVVLPDDPADADLGGAVGSLDARIDAERAEAVAAARALADTRARLEAADAALAEAVRRVDALVTDAGVLVGTRFLGPRSEKSRPSASGATAAEQAPQGDATPALALPLTVDSALLDRFVQARDRLAAEAEKRSNAEAQATEQARRAEEAQSGVEAAAARKAEFLEEARQRLTQELDKATRVGDTERLAEVEARRDELISIAEAPTRAVAARKAKADADARARAKAEAGAVALAEAEAAVVLRPAPIGQPTGGYPAVRCPGGGSIAVDGSLAHNLNAMLLTAWRDGVDLCGGGYRDPQRQIQLRIQNCGSSDYAIY